MALQTGLLTFGSIETKGTSYLAPLSIVRVPKPISYAVIALAIPISPSSFKLAPLSIVRVPKPLPNVVIAAVPGGATVSTAANNSQYWG